MGNKLAVTSSKSWFHSILSKIPADRFFWYALLLVPLLALLMMACGGGGGGEGT